MKKVHAYVFVTGSRHAGERKADRPRHYQVIREALSAHARDSTVLVHGDCRGTDRLAANYPWAGVLPVAANWPEHGRKAGPLRNAVLVDLARTLREAGYKVFWHAFPTRESRGTWDCVQKVKAAGFEVQVHPLDP